MASLPRVIDVEDVPELERIINVVREGQEELGLRQHGEEVALISPLPVPARRGRKRIVTEAELEAIRAAAGGWKGLVDTEKLLEDIYSDRDIGDRPPVEL
jgi:hypothetical protein